MAGDPKQVSAVLAPVMKAAGFRKTALTFARRRGEVEQFVNAQFSSGGSGAFYVNVGVRFDAVTALGGDDVQVMVGKHPVHHGVRLERLVAGAPAQWSLSARGADERLRRALVQVIAWLDPIDRPAAMLAQHPLDAGFEKVLRAQLRWVTGDRAGARKDLARVAAEFSDRLGLTVATLAANAGLEL